MTDTSHLDTLKRLAKQYARTNRIPHHQALDLIANVLDFPHWKAVAAAARTDWNPNAEQMTEVEAFVRETYSPPERSLLGEGKIGPHSYQIEDDLDDAHIFGEGWHIHLSEAPSADPIVAVTDRRIQPNPIYDPEFVREALEIARARAKEIHARIAQDWPRRSTKPDADGNARHPLHGDLSNEWYCLHCDGKSSAEAIASNFWHCPNCGATPIDIFSAPFWLSNDVNRVGVQMDQSGHAPSDRDGTSQKKAIGSPIKANSPVSQKDDREHEIIDTTPSLDLNASKIELLIRTALLDDAKNTGERMAVLLAEIGVDEDRDAYVVLDEDLWPEGKEPVQAIKVADLLGIDLELFITSGSAPFHWPALAEATDLSAEYVSILLDAYSKFECD